MEPLKPALSLAAVALLAACATSAPSGSNAGTEQLRASLAPRLQWAGLSDACIAQLDTATLVQMKSLVEQTPHGSREYLQRRQRIQVAAARDCDDL